MREYTPAKEQLRLIKECQQSGMTIADWCRQKGIRIDTFYSWKFRMMKKGLIDTAATIPQPFFQDPVRPDIVKVNISSIDDPIRPRYESEGMPTIPVCETVYSATIPVMEVTIGNTVLRVTNQVNPQLLAEMIRLLGGGSRC